MKPLLDEQTPVEMLAESYQKVLNAWTDTVIQNDKLRELVKAIWLETGRYAETQLTTEQKDLLYKVANPDGERWWER